MPHILAKIGSNVNVATYEHYCDTITDRDNIDPREINLGSTCIVVEGENGGVEAYIANSNKEWKKMGG